MDINFKRYDDSRTKYILGFKKGDINIEIALTLPEMALIARTFNTMLEGD